MVGPLFAPRVSEPAQRLERIKAVLTQVGVDADKFDEYLRNPLMHAGTPLEMVRTGNLVEEVRLNMREVLDRLESIIRRWVGQWQMYVPVWPELLEARR